MPEVRRLPVEPERAATVAFTVDARPLAARPGETVATALLAAGVARFRHTRQGEPRAPFCNMGSCLECLVAVDGEPLRACLTPVHEGMAVTTLDQGQCAPTS